MCRRGFAVLLPMVLGCHPASETVHAVQDLSDDTKELETATRIDPEITATQSACEDQHDVHACTQVAEYWQGENGQPFDPKKGFHFASRGCGGGDALACAILGNHYQNGLGTMWAPRYAIRLHEQSCNAGTGLGCIALSGMYARGHGVAVDRAKAIFYFKRAHEQWLAACLGSEPRWCLYAAASASAREGEPTAHELYQRGCDNGVARACIQVLHDQLIHPTGSRDATMRELDQWCSRGASAACEELASAYELPNGPQDSKHAAALTKRACVLGDPHACVKIGILHESERGVPRDDAVARRYFSRACDRGASLGCWYLAQDTIVAGGSDSEVARAARRGCEMGNIEACDLITKLYLGYHEETAVVQWATEACRIGSSTGCRHLIARDIELPRTTTDAVQLYHAACNEKIASACQRLPKLIQEVDSVLRGVVATAAKQDATAFAKLVAHEVYMHGLRFQDPDCATQFSGTIVLTATQHPTFVRCLAKLAPYVELAPDSLSSPSLAYNPEMKLTLEVRDGIVQEIQGYSTAEQPLALQVSPEGTNPRAGSRNVAPTALEVIRIAGERNILPDSVTHAAIVAAGSPQLIGSFKVCITRHGTIASVTMLKSTGSMAYDRTLERGIFRWRYQPFMIDGEPAPVCTAVTFVYGPPPPAPARR